MTAEACIDNRGAGALGTEHVGAENADEIGVLLDHSGGLLLRLVQIIEIIVRAKHLDVGEFLRHHFLEALLAAFD